MAHARRHALLGRAASSLMYLLAGGSAWAFPTYDDCEACHGEFHDFQAYTSLHDGVMWPVDLMLGHLTYIDDVCEACHKAGQRSEVFLNQSVHASLNKACVGCHGRAEDVTGNCTGQAGELGGVEAECGSGAGLRLVHESKVGAGTCSGCHGGDGVPVGEDVAPFNYGRQFIAVQNSCNADGTESRFGPTGLDNDGDGLRDGDDPDCQSNSPTITINPGLNDAWYHAATPGQGFFIIVFEDTGIIFMAWFTYDTELPPEEVIAQLGAAEHRWVTAQGPFDGDTAMLDVYLTEGGVFDSAEPKPVTGDPIGTITIVWHDCEHATLTYDIDPPGVQGQMEIIRIVPDNVSLCEALNES